MRNLDSKSAVVWMFVSPQNSCIDILTPEMMVLGDGAFGRGWVHKGGAIIMGWGPRELAWSFLHVKMEQEAAFSELESKPSPEPDHVGTLILDFQLPELGQRCFCYLEAAQSDILF